jgi:hypothetical protein
MTAGMVLLVVFVVLRCLLCVESKFEQTFARLVAAGMVLLVVFVVLRCLLCVESKFEQTCEVGSSWNGTSCCVCCAALFVVCGEQV